MNDRTPPIRPAHKDAIIEAARLIRAGALVAFPTETVYGLGADATDDRAVAAIFDAKRRPRFNPLIVHVPDLDAARALARFDERAERVAEALWPGPISLVLPRQPNCPVSLLASAGLPSLAVRVPDHPVALALLRAVARPVAAPSANVANRLSPTAAAHVAEGLGDRVTMILDGGPCRVGVESTVLDLCGSAPIILRQGGVTMERLTSLVGTPVESSSAADGEARPSPGMSLRHYAPERPLRLRVAEGRAGEALLAFGPLIPPGQWAKVMNLSPSGDVVEAAANLFAMLHALDRPEYAAIAVATIPGEGLGRAINDRLTRAAATSVDKGYSAGA